MTRDIARDIWSRVRKGFPLDTQQCFRKWSLTLEEPPHTLTPPQPLIPMYQRLFDETSHEERQQFFDWLKYTPATQRLKDQASPDIT